MVGNENQLMIIARRVLFEKLTAGELIRYRKVCRDWRKQINELFEKRVFSVFLFSSRYNLLQFLHFIKRANLENDVNYTLNKTSQSLPNFVLFVSSIECFANNNLFIYFKSAKHLIYFGEPELDKQRYTAGSLGGRWHDASQMSRIISKLPNLTALMVHHFGYYAAYFPLQKCPLNFSRLTSIHLVQPSLHAYTELIKDNEFAIPKVGYDFRNGALPIQPTYDVPKVDGQTYFFVHFLIDYSDAHSETQFPSNIQPEKYLSINISFN